ncbi:piggyBac transposable element-derived protein 4 [Antennarius striatus]|uniref:piggyBac transposable element-derived protein 4 n=1 Tax=Antennarius striatus TaxID=241820 RepID=UPI0035ADE174
MKRTLNVRQVVQMLEAEDEEDVLSSPSSSEEDSSEEDDNTDLTLVGIDETYENRPGPSTKRPGPSTKRPGPSIQRPGPSTKRPRKRGRGRTAQTRGSFPQTRPQHALQPWRTRDDPDTAPHVSRFVPRRTPGAQVDSHAIHSPLELFQLYFSPSTLRTLCDNTNKQAARNKAMGKKYKWTDVDCEELCKVLGLLIYTSLVSVSNISDYWKQASLMSVPLPSTIMPRDRFRAVLSNIHPSDPEEDENNEARKGTPEYDKLFKVKPLMNDIINACKAHCHPRRELAVDERMVATKAKTGMTQYMKDKPMKWGVKLFVLADSSNGYTINFNIYIGKKYTETVHGLAYDAVMDLIQPSYLGTGYHVYMDNFYTSPQLFLKLTEMEFGACGTYRDNRKGCPTQRANALAKKSERGEIRWIREGSLVFVKWMDTREVSVCSNIQPAVSGEVVRRRVKDKDGSWSVKDIPCPSPVIAYNKYMGVVDRSDQLLQYYSTHHKTARWYRTVFLHMLDIATTNAYLLHCDISKSHQLKPLTHKNFQAELVAQLCQVDLSGRPARRSTNHVPVGIAVVADPTQMATQGRRICQQCNQVYQRRNLTPWKCKACDVALCVILNRNCFEEWHE